MSKSERVESLGNFLWWRNFGVRGFGWGYDCGQAVCETFKVFRILTPNPLDTANYRYQTGTDLDQYRYLLGGVAHNRDDVL